MTPEDITGLCERLRAGEARIRSFWDHGVTLTPSLQKAYLAQADLFRAAADALEQQQQHIAEHGDIIGRCWRALEPYGITNGLGDVSEAVKDVLRGQSGLLRTVRERCEAVKRRGNGWTAAAKECADSILAILDGEGA